MLRLLAYELHFEQPGPEILRVKDCQSRRLPGQDSRPPGPMPTQSFTGDRDCATVSRHVFSHTGELAFLQLPVAFR